MEEFVINEHTFRIKKMNALELMALRTQISNKTYESALNAYMSLLEKIEVQVKDKWMPVKQGNNFYPAGIEDDIDTIQELILKIMGYINEVFTKSNALKKETE